MIRGGVRVRVQVQPGQPPDQRLDGHLGLEPGDADSAALGRRIQTDIARWSAVAKKANIQPQ